MGKINYIYKLIDGFGFSIWGLTIIDLASIVNIPMFDKVDKWIQVATVLAGLIALFEKIRHSYLNNKHIRDERRIKNELEQENLNQIRWDNEQKKTEENELR